MSKKITAIFDGKVLRPEGKVDLKPNTRYMLTVEKESREDVILNRKGLRLRRRY